MRFDPAVSVFGALPDEPTPEAWDAMAELVGPGGLALLIRARASTRPTAGPSSSAASACRWRGPGPLARRRIGAESAPTGVDVVRLGPATTWPRWSALVARTEPGPFTDRTIELGTYLGVRDASDGALVAMAGQRMHPPGHVEISAVCTDPAFRGRGLARMLVELLVDEITDAATHRSCTRPAATPEPSASTSRWGSRSDASCASPPSRLPTRRQADQPVTG